LKLNGKIALVTGGGSGIGKAMAKAILAEGAKVIIIGRTESKLLQAQSELGPEIEIMVCDITLESQVTNVYETIMSKYGKLDILINNAGTSFKEKAHKLSFESWKKVIDVNLNGAFLCARGAMKIMVSQKLGRIINIGSISGQMSRPLNAPYTLVSLV